MKVLSSVLLLCLLTAVPSPAADEPAKERPSVADKKSGISVGVRDDGRGLVATDRRGKPLWEADVIKAAGAPAAGRPVVRRLRLKDGVVAAAYGEHAFAEFDLTTGALLRSGDKLTAADVVARHKKYHPRGAHFVDTIRPDGKIAWASRVLKGEGVETRSRLFATVKEFEEAFAKEGVDKEALVAVHDPVVNAKLREAALRGQEIMKFLKEKGYKVGAFAN
jgi:hypothetical protein